MSPSVTYDKNDTQNKHFLIEILQYIYSFVHSTENFNDYYFRNKKRKLN